MIYREDFTIKKLYKHKTNAMRHYLLHVWISDYFCIYFQIQYIEEPTGNVLSSDLDTSDSNILMLSSTGQANRPTICFLTINFFRGKFLVFTQILASPKNALILYTGGPMESQGRLLNLFQGYITSFDSGTLPLLGGTSSGSGRGMVENPLKYQMMKGRTKWRKMRS